MKTKLFSLLILFLALQYSLTAGDDNTRINLKESKLDLQNPNLPMIPLNHNPESVVFTIPLAYGFSTDSLLVGPEIPTGIRGYYDYKSNGEANVYIQVDPLHPDTIQVIDVVADVSDPTGTTTRRTKWTYSTNHGVTWETSIEVPSGIRSGYPVLQLLNSAAIIANHGNATFSSTNTVLYRDLVALAGVFDQLSFPSSAPWGIWPQITVYDNGNVGILGRRNTGVNGPETLFYSVFNGTSIAAWSPVFFTTNVYQGSVGSNMRFHIADNNAGTVTIIAAPVLQDDTLGVSKMFYRTSTNNGANWGPVNTAFAPYTINAGADTVQASGGSGFTYKKNTNKWFLAYPISADGLFATGSLVMTKFDGTSLSTSTITTAAAVGATSTYANNMAFVFNVDFPALGWSADGSTLYCVYSVVMPDTSRGFNQRDIFISYSLNEGSTWSTPLRLTNTPTIDEAYPSISDWNKGSGSTFEVNITYMKDPGVGPTSFNGSGTTGAATENAQVYRKLTGLPPIGIGNNQNTVREYKLSQNYPNPFNPSTKIDYNINVKGLVTLKVYDVLGREVAVLVNEIQDAGAKSVQFNASNLTSGIYFYTINSGDFKDTKTMVLVK